LGIISPANAPNQSSRAFCSHATVDGWVCQ
jgi:hypothetical protein